MKYEVFLWFPTISSDIGDSLARSVEHHVFSTMIPPILPALRPNGSLESSAGTAMKMGRGARPYKKALFTSITATHLLCFFFFLQEWRPSTPAQGALAFLQTAPLPGVIGELLSHQAGFDHVFFFCAFVRQNPILTAWVGIELLFLDDFVDLHPLKLLRLLLFYHNDNCGIEIFFFSWFTQSSSQMTSSGQQSGRRESRLTWCPSQKIPLGLTSFAQMLLRLDLSALLEWAISPGSTSESLL